MANGSAAFRGEAMNDMPVRITGVEVVFGPDSEDYADITFDLAWNDSWRSDRNWDAVWVFIKCRSTETESVPDHLAKALLGLGDAAMSREQLAAEILALMPCSSDASPPYDEATPATLASTPATLEILHEGKSWRIVQRFVYPALGPRGEHAVERVVTMSHVDGAIMASEPGCWAHAKISGVVKKPDEATIDIPEDGLGAFVYASASLEQGPVDYRRITLRCACGDRLSARAQGLSVWVFGLEMVHIPEGKFFLGEPRAADLSNTAFFLLGSRDGQPFQVQPFQVQSNAPIRMMPPGAVPREGGPVLSYKNSGIGTPGDYDEIPAAFPKGYDAFYLMKRHIAQGEYAQFLCTLETTAQVARLHFGFNESRYTIYLGSSQFFAAAARPSRACNWLSLADGLAFTAWAALRPMTELEFEKACRGTEPSKENEFAWGTSQCYPAQLILGQENGTEAVAGNCNIGNTTGTAPFLGGDGGYGPVRDDAFAGPGRPNSAQLFPPACVNMAQPVSPQLMRECTGATFYGVMGMSGNLWDFCVTVGDARGRSFTGRHGDGTVDYYGCARVKELGWPLPNTRGAGVRGGSWLTRDSLGRVSDRTYAAGLLGFASRAADLGFRAARTAR